MRNYTSIITILTLEHLINEQTHGIRVPYTKTILLVTFKVQTTRNSEILPATVEMSRFYIVI